MKQEELSVLKHQNVSRSLSFGFPTYEDTRQLTETSFQGHVCDMDVEDADDFLENESKGSVRMSNKQVHSSAKPLHGGTRTKLPSLRSLFSACSIKIQKHVIFIICTSRIFVLQVITCLLINGEFS